MDQTLLSTINTSLSVSNFRSLFEKGVGDFFDLLFNTVPANFWTVDLQHNLKVN